jgi:hypothetical protein
MSVASKASAWWSASSASVLQAGARQGGTRLVEILDPCEDGPAVRDDCGMQLGVLPLQQPQAASASVGGPGVADHCAHGSGYSGAGVVCLLLDSLRGEAVGERL